MHSSSYLYLFWMIALVQGFSRFRLSKRKMQQTFLSSGFTYDENQPLQKIYNHLRQISQSPDYDRVVQQPVGNILLEKCFEEMNNLKLNDFGLTDVNLKNVKNNYCLNIACNDKFHIALFILGKQGEIPLHDHPKMTVLSKVLYGSLDVGSYTKVNSTSTDVTTVTLDYRVTRTPSDNGWLLTPNNGNIHSFSNSDILKPCLIFDILMPPYLDDEDRPCNFYKISGDLCSTYYLENIPGPENLPLSVNYNGYKPIDV